MGFVIFLLIIGGLFMLISFSIKKANKAAEEVREAAEQARKDWIYKKYGQTEIADKIINKTVWVGETSEQLTDSLGQPIDIDEQVLKTKKKEVWKYYRKSVNRYGFKVIIENGIVIGWDEKL